MRTYHIAWWNLENLFDEENGCEPLARTKISSSEATFPPLAPRTRPHHSRRSLTNQSSWPASTTWPSLPESGDRLLGDLPRPVL